MQMQMSRSKCYSSSHGITQLHLLLRQSFTSSSHSPSSSTFLTRPSYSTSPKPEPILSSFPHSSPPPPMMIYLTAGCLSAIRLFSSKPPSKHGSEVDIGFPKKALEKPAVALTSTFSRYRESMVLQFEAFFKRNQLFLLGAAGVVLWRILFGVANTFWRFTINPDKLYRIATTRLNTSAEILQVMGAPLTGTDLRAYVMSGGGLTLKKIKPNLRSRRCFLIFHVNGSERNGLVNVEVKKKKGKYDVKLLAVDVPRASGLDQRLYLIGNEKEYKVGGGLINELRDPVVKAMAAAKEFDDLDEIEEEADAERERQEAEQKHREEIEKLENRDTK